MPFEAKLQDGQVLKKIVDSIKDLVTDVNIDATPQGLSLQAMDSSHVALVNLQLSKDGFEKYQADRPLTLGLSITNLAKVTGGIAQQVLGTQGGVHQPPV